jgi:hypothetical protein
MRGQSGFLRQPRLRLVLREVVRLQEPSAKPVLVPFVFFLLDVIKGPSSASTSKTDERLF